MQRFTAVGLSLLGLSFGPAATLVQRAFSSEIVQEESVIVGVESNGFTDAFAAMRMAEAALSNSVELAELGDEQAELAAPAVDCLIPQSEEQRIFQRANGGKYIELASGLNYQDEAGVWKPSRVAPTTLGNGSVIFDELPVQHTFAPWSGQRVVVESSRRSGPVAKSTLGGLSYYDLSSGKSALIAWVTNSPVQAYDGGVFYERAFLGVDADILYKVHPWGLEQDVVIFGGLPDPKAFGMDPAQTKLCALTELVDFDLSQAGVERSGGVAPAVPAVASLEVSTKQGTDWKRLYNWQPGFAYPEEGALMVGASDSGDQAHPVAMRLFSAMGRVFLSEEVPVSHVARSMPELLDAKVEAGVARVETIREQNPLALPPVRSNDRLVADQSRILGPQAYIRRAPRYVLDYVNYTGNTNFNITFLSGTTYYISGPFTVNYSVLTVQPGTVVKLATNAYVRLFAGRLDCRSHLGNPAYFTSAYDTNIGEIVLSGLSPATNLYSAGISLYYSTGEVRGIQFSYASRAVELLVNASERYEISDIKVANSKRGIYTSVSADGRVRNSLFRDGAEGASLRGAVGVIEGCTFQNLTNWAVGGSSGFNSLMVSNCVFYSVSNAFYVNGCTQYYFVGNAAYNVTTGWMGTSVVSLASNTFAVGPYGSNYLMVGSAAINAGTTNADLMGLYHYTTATNGLKETNSLVDIGFHYGTVADEDFDGIPDYLEDRSGDGLYTSNSMDISNWQSTDTDGDGLADGAEYSTYGTNPKSDDTDGDGVSDGLEVQYGTDPLSTTSTLWSVSGTVAYGGVQTGTLHVLVTSYEPLTNRPAMDYSFDEDRGGYTPDLNGSGLEAIVYGATWSTNGAKGGCYTFDGNDRISLGRLDAANGRYNLTWTAWMRYTGGGVLGGLLGNTAAGNEGIMLMKGGANLRADITPQSRTQTIIAETGGLVTQGIWQMVSGTYDGTQVRLYLNGDLVATSAVYSLEPIRTSTVSAAVGDVTDGRGWYFYGDLDEVRIYQTTFSTNQMKSLFFEIGGSVIRRDWTTNVLASSTAFTVPNLPSGSNYWITAWRDANGNGRMDHGEAQGRYSGFVGNLGGHSNNLAVTLADPDLDGDGVVDHMEMAAMTDPRSSNSVPVTAAGQVIYSGGQTGPIYITARPYETIADTPLLRYSFNTSNSTIVLDESGNGITGLISNAKWTSRGIRSGAYRFDGNANINLGDLSAVEGRTGLTWGAWVNQSYSSSLRGIMGKMVSGGESFLLVSTPSSGSLNSQVVPQSRAQARDAAVNGVATGMVWQYVAGTYDGQQTRLYLDGQLIATSPVYAVEGIMSNNTLAALGDVAVGRGWYMNGRLDDVHIFGRCFNTNEMYSLAASIQPENIIRVITNAQPGAFVFTNLPNARKYWFEAYRDSNGNGQRDGAEAWVVWSNNPAFLQTAITNINLTLSEADTDQDGTPDWWEIKYGLNPTSSIPGSGEGWWKFDETSGTNAANSTGSGYGGQLVNMATNAWSSGKLGNALLFDGTNDYVRVPQSPVIITGQTYTLSGWVWLDPSSANDYPSIISDMSTCSGGYPGYWLGYDQFGPGLGHMGGVCGNYFYAYNAISVTGRWMHIAATYDGSTARLFADGVQIATTSGTFTQALQSEVRIGWGNDPAASYFWKGKLDDVRLYKTAISSNAVATMYDALADGDGDGISSIQEYQAGTHPNKYDSDSDGLVDGADGLVSTNSYPQGADADLDGYVDGENDYGTSPWKYDSDGDGLVDGKDGLISTNTYVVGIDSDRDGYVDGEMDLKTNPVIFDSDGDGIDDGIERYFNTNPTNQLTKTGINRNWLFHNNVDSSSATWELIPGLWQRFLMLDYKTGTNTVHFLVPTNVVLDVNGALVAEVRFWDGSQKWTTASYFTSTVVSVSNAFHGLPTMGAITLNVYRAEWVQSTSVMQSVSVSFAPFVKAMTNGTQTDYAYLASGLLAEDAGVIGCVSNNWWFAPQVLARHYFGRDYSFVYSPVRLTNGNFESGSPPLTSNPPGWTNLGPGTLLSSNITRGLSTRSFVATDIGRIYQNIGVHAGEELIISGYMLTPSLANTYDPSPITTDRYGMVSIEYYDRNGDNEAVGGSYFTSTNSQDQWVYFAITSLVPRRAVSANLSLRMEVFRPEVWGSGHVYFDDISLAISPDTDRDGMPDRWEANYAGQMSTNLATDSMADPDADGLRNIEEYRMGLNPVSVDSDSDGMPDKWELDRGLDPRSSADAGKDSDGDRLTNLQEYQHGTDPLIIDTDRDGLDDGAEVLDHGLNPSLGDFGGFTTVQAIDGSNIVGSLGQWTNVASAICAVDRRGYVEYALNVPSNDVYRIQMEGFDRYAQPGNSLLELRVSLDSVYLERVYLLSTAGSTSTANCYLPWTTTGVHTVRVYWDNVGLEQSLCLTKVRLQSASGADANANGLKDWVENRISRLSGVEVAPSSSYISPACLEGRDPYLGMMSISTGYLCNAAGDRWYGDVNLSETSSISVRISFQNGGRVTTNAIAWKRTNLLSAPSMSIRKNDALLLTAYPDGATNGTVGITIVGLTNWITTVNSPVAFRFTNAGVYTILGTYTPVSGAATGRSINAQVLAGGFGTNPACWTYVSRYMVCSNLPLQAVVEFDDRLLMSEVTSTGGAARAFYIRATEPENRYIIARTESEGAILTNAAVRGFRLGASTETGVQVQGICDTGEQLIETTLVASPVFSDMRITGEIIVGGLLFGDGNLTNQWTTADFDVLGQCRTRFIRAASSQTSFCNVLNVYQGTEFVGRYRGN